MGEAQVNYGFTRVSQNRKIGPMAVTMTSRSSCPTTCSYRGAGCYAENFPLVLHWSKLDGAGKTIDAVCGDIRSLPKGSMLRINQAGDLAHNNGQIDPTHLGKLMKATKRVKAFGYTHHRPEIGNNADLLKAANDSGLTLNLSAESLSEADALADLAIAPVVVAVPRGTPKVTTTPAGRHVVMCPAYHTEIDCASCGVCAVNHRRSIIAFEAHGSTRAKVEKVFWAKSG